VSPPRVAGDGTRGWIVPIGGAEDKVRDTEILRRFVHLAGRDRARIAVIPTASEMRDTGPSYAGLFEKLGARSATSLPFDSRADCEREDLLGALGAATGVFLTGGNQLRLSTVIGGTSVARLLRRLSADGVPIAGTSAGAAFLPEHMIAHGDEGPTPRAGIVTLAPGLGVTNAIVVDQHFRQRDRLGRLMTALAYNPFAIGVGLDEDSAAFLRPDGVLEIHGSGAVTIVDPSGVEHTSIGNASPQEPVCIVGIRLHVLTDGWSFDLSTRKALAAPARAPR
jgi:cyanophycinase